MKNIFTLTIIILSSILQANDTSKSNSSFQQTEQKYELVALDVSNIKTEIGDLKKQLDKVEDNTKDIIQFYLIVLGFIVTVIISLLKIFGRKLIQDRVEDIIRDTAKEHIENKILETLNSKITDDIIERVIKAKSDEEVAKLINYLHEKGNTAINTISEKGYEAISALSKNSIKSNQESEIPLTDIQISQNNTYRIADELFSLAYNSNDPRIKIELYNSALRIDPNNPNALNNLGVAYNSVNKPLEAIDVLTKAINLEVDHFKAYTNRAQSYNLLNEFDKALLDLKISLDINPSLEYSYGVKGNILTKLHRFQEAEIELNKAIEINVNSGEAYFNRAFYFEEQKEFSKSELDYKKAEELGVINKSMLFNNMAVLYRRMKKFDVAIEYLDKARSESPDFPNIDGTLALIYADKNDDQNFYKYLEIALQKGCRAWDYLKDPGFDKYRETEKLKNLIEPYKNKYLA